MAVIEIFNTELVVLKKVQSVTIMPRKKRKRDRANFLDQAKREQIKQRRNVPPSFMNKRVNCGLVLLLG